MMNDLDRVEMALEELKAELMIYRGFLDEGTVDRARLEGEFAGLDEAINMVRIVRRIRL
jgi:hypothetical protein